MDNNDRHITKALEGKAVAMSRMALVSSIHALKCFASDSSLEAMHWMPYSGELVNETWCEAKQWKVGCSVSRSQPLVNVPNEEPQHRV